MKKMRNSLVTKIFACLVVGLMSVVLVFPGAQAKVILGIEGSDGSEGDPLDSNDFGTGGGSGNGDSDNDIQDALSVPSDDLFTKVIRTLLVTKSGAIVLPLFQGGVPVINYFSIQNTDLPAVNNAD